MKQLELIIIVGNQFVSHITSDDEVLETNRRLQEAVESHGWFSVNSSVFARGDSISGWYYREVRPTAVDAMNKMAKALENQASEGNDWKDK